MDDDNALIFVEEFSAPFGGSHYQFNKILQILATGFLQIYQSFAQWTIIELVDVFSPFCLEQGSIIGSLSSHCVCWR